MKNWYALYTKPHKERQVEGLLQGRGIETYLPTVLRKVRRRDRPDRVIYFPCYMFARIDFDQVPASSVEWMPGMRRIVRFGPSPAVVPEELVEVVRERLGDVQQVSYGKFKKGDRVRIESGPMRDLVAIFDQPMSSADRVRVLLEVMGRLTVVELDYTNLTKLE
ncbi:MAG TPA: transcription termination/antitermination NusG family protein [Anaerolineae bacterium]|nr:transcription termination/antitermination NusG family protein [Anaerolineae bacterium]